MTLIVSLIIGYFVIDACIKYKEMMNEINEKQK